MVLPCHYPIKSLRFCSLTSGSKEAQLAGPPGVRHLRCPPAPATSGPSSLAWSVACEAPRAPGTPCPACPLRRAPVSSVRPRLAASRPVRRRLPASAPRALSSSSPPPWSPRFARSGPRPRAAAAPLRRRSRQLHRRARLSPASAQPPPASASLVSAKPSLPASSSPTSSPQASSSPILIF